MEPTSQLVLVAAAGAEPLTLTAAKNFLRQDLPDDDALITGLCMAARDYAEKFCRRSFLTGDVYKLTLNRFPYAYFRDSLYNGVYEPEFWGAEANYLYNRPQAFSIEIPMGPISAITSVNYIDFQGNSQTLDPSLYALIADDNANPRLYPAYGTWWPQTEIRPDAVTINFTVGGVCPQLVLTAMQQMVAHWYVNREAVVITSSTAQNVPLLAETLLWPYRLLEF